MTEGRHRAKRSLGQNFLVDGNLQRKIVSALGAGPDDEVVEIGPGQGALTQHLVGRVGRLVLVELDDSLARGLHERYGDDPSVQVVHGDVLDTDLVGAVSDWSAARVVGNIPYNITTPILFQLLLRPRPREIVLMVQREVADRIVAAPGSGAYGALAVGVQSVADVRFLFPVPRKAFRPVPRVESAVVRVVPHAPPRLTPHDEERLRLLTRAAFQWRRKQMQKILRSHPDIGLPEEVVARLGRELDVDLTRRPETFSPGLLLAIARSVL
ncbi:MAG TPA: 16S rRNA (adenine(1518)-N(6)/adenine(1519)-N(6))-dimethyltransferase RsmA [Longimicrobiales bacterium]|nr:16S rRNA (adenine(1518)-N(6)/adenine(1519)-N(6))-dimethyltransferase RsmA [Longimicrobiales bacterium]